MLKSSPQKNNDEQAIDKSESSIDYQQVRDQNEGVNLDAPQAADKGIQK